MRIVNIEITHLKGNETRYSATWYQVSYIQTLMLRRGLHNEFLKYFIIGNRVVCNHITKTSASNLIKALLDNKTEIHFIEYVTVPKNLPTPKIRTLYVPTAPQHDVKRITVNEQKALEQKYTEES